jgi:6-phosphofructokinase 1
VPFDLDRLIELLIEDKKNNPSRYALVVMSEGASWKGRSVEEFGETDAFGHRKKRSIAEAFSEQVKKKANEDTVVSDLTYDLRSGEPDFLDKMIATTFANMAFELIASGSTGRMVGIRNGCYTDSEIPDPALGPRKVDSGSMYNVERFRPNYGAKKGLPIFMTRV